MDMRFVNSADGFRAILEDLLKTARARGAEAAEAEVSESVDMEAAVRCGRLDNWDFNRGQGVSLTVFVNGRSGSAVAATLAPEALGALVDRAIAIARATMPDPYAGLADKGWLATEFPDLGLAHPWALESDAAIALACRAEEAAFAAHPAVSREKSDGASVGTHAALEAYANTHGFSAAEASTEHFVSCTAVAEADGAMETDGWSETRRNAADLPAPEEVGAIAGRFAARRLGGGRLEDCRADVLFLAPAAHSLIGHFIAAASGGALYRNTSFLRGRLGERVFAEALSIRELPHLRGELASGAYDSDGVATRTRDVVRDGVWQGCFLSAYSARKLGMVGTGNAGGVHNLDVTFAPGFVVPAAELTARLGRGLIVTDLMGQGANTVTGDYSRGAAGFWVENGEVAYPVSEVTVAGNLSEMLAGVAAAGDDAVRRGAIKCGSLLLPDLVVGGNR